MYMYLYLYLYVYVFILVLEITDLQEQIMALKLLVLLLPEVNRNTLQVCAHTVTIIGEKNQISQISDHNCPGISSCIGISLFADIDANYWKPISICGL